MPVASNVSISQCYAAFDRDAHRVYREAMRWSQQGVVTVAHLVEAIGRNHCDVTIQVLGLPATLVHELCSERVSPSPASATYPLANEPALRELLRATYARTRGAISPRSLLETARDMSLLPLAWRPRPTPPPRSCKPNMNGEQVNSTRNDLLARWIDAQSIEDSRDRNGALNELAAEISRLGQSVRDK